MRAQRFQVGAAHLGGRARQRFGEFGERALLRSQPRAAIVPLDLLGQLRVAGFLTEILSVGLDSIEAAVDLRHHRGQQLALGA